MPLNYFETVGVFFKACFTYVFPGPPRKSWSLAQHAHVVVTRQILSYPKPKDRHKLLKHFYGIREVTEQRVSRTFESLSRSFGPLSFGELAVPSLDRLLSELYPDIPLRGQADSMSIGCEWLFVGERFKLSDIKPETRVFLTLHGGAYALMSPRTHRQMSCNMSKGCGAVVFSLEYRLSPEHPFPAAMFDAVSAYVYLVSTLGIKPGQIVIQGDSAGGGLAMATILFLRDFGSQIEQRLELASGSLAGIRAYVGFSPWLDLTMEGITNKLNNKTDILMNPASESEIFPSWMYVLGEACFDVSDAELPVLKQKVAQITRQNYYMSPVFADNFDNLPPMFIIAGSAELIASDSISTFGRMAGLLSKEELQSREKHQWLDETTQDMVTYNPADKNCSLVQVTDDGFRLCQFASVPSGRKIRVELFHDQIHVFMAFPHIRKRRDAFVRLASWIDQLPWEGRTTPAPKPEEDGLFLVF